MNLVTNFCLRVLFVPLIITMTKLIFGSNGVYFDLHFHVSVQQGKAGQGLRGGRNLEVGIELETMGECYLLACSSWIPEVSFL